MATFVGRVLGALRLDVATFEDVEADSRATSQALIVVILSSLAGGVGLGGTIGVTLGSLMVSTLGSLIAWVAWALLIYYLGAYVFPQPQTRADPGQLLRTIGFAAAPGLLRPLVLVPVVRPVIFVVVSVWMLMAMVVAVRQALDYTSTWRALGVCLAGWLLSLIIAFVIGLVLAPPLS